MLPARGRDCLGSERGIFSSRLPVLYRLVTAHIRLGVWKNVDVKEGETGAVHEALDGMTDHGRENGLSGLSHRLPQTHR